MKIFTKLFLLLLLISAVPLGIMGGVVLWRSSALKKELVADNDRTGKETSHASLHALFIAVRDNHLQVALNKAADLEAFFERGREIVKLEAALAEAYLAEPPALGSPPLYSAADFSRRLQIADFREKTFGKQPYGVFSLKPGALEAKQKATVLRLARLGEFFATTVQAEPSIRNVYIGRSDGFMLSYPDLKPPTAANGARATEWFDKAVEKGRVTWTDFYTDADSRTAIACVDPVFSGGRLAAVAAVDFNADDFLRQLLDVGALNASDAVLVNYAGQVRIAAVYGADGRVRLQSTPPDASPSVATYMGGQFKPAFDAAVSSGSGTVLLDHEAKPLDLSKSRDGDLLAYSRVRIQTREGGKFWYYIVRTPLAEVIKPVHEVHEKLASLNTLLSTAISRAIRSLGLQIGAMVVFVLVCALILAYAAARSVTRPLLHIAEVVAEMGKGRLDRRVQAGGKDEIGDLGAAINRMAQGLQEGLFVKQTFKRYVAASVVDHLLQNPEKLKLGGDRRELTVFFSDVSGFTSFSERLPPEFLVELVNEYLSEMTDAIFRYEGTLDKYVGDAIVAFWGAPVEQPDHALRACRAALDNLAALRKLGPKWQERGLPPLDIRIGINTGPMVVGNMGSLVKLDYTVMGDAVNLGSRLEGANKAYGTRILMSEATRLGAGDAVLAREVDLLEVKGKQVAVRVYELLGLAGSLTEEQLGPYRAYERGLQAYRQRLWDEAEARFQEALTGLGNDPVSREMLARVAAFRLSPPPSEWDGRHVLAEK